MAESEMASLREEIRVLRIVVKDLTYIVKGLVELEPRISQEYATALDDHLNSLGGEDNG